jgi:hypothetical protein
MSACSGLGIDKPVRGHHRRGGADPSTASSSSFVFLLQAPAIELQGRPAPLSSR